MANVIIKYELPNDDADAETPFISESYANSLKCPIIEVPLIRGDKICGRYGDKSVTILNDELSTIPHMTDKEIDSYIENGAGRKAKIIDRFLKPWTVEEEIKFKEMADKLIPLGLRDFLEANGVVTPNEANTPLRVMTEGEVDKIVELKKVLDVLAQEKMLEPLSVKINCDELGSIDKDKLLELLSDKFPLNEESSKDE